MAAQLRAAGGAPVSGEALAVSLGISRVAVAKHISALRDLGYEIESQPRRGYRLMAEPDVCLPETVAPRLSDGLWVSCGGGLETGSTNDDAKRLARAGAPEGTLVLASSQSAGRGRFGREWASPHAGVYASAVLRPHVAPREVAPLGLVVSVGVARALIALGVPVGLKWPNDVVTSRGKVAGILLEMAGEADTVEWVVVGCGVNVGDPGLPVSDGVHSAVPSARVPDVAAAVLDAIASTYQQWLSEGFSALADEYRRLGTLWGAPVQVADATGAVVACGVADDIDDTGALVLREDAQRRTVSTGEVTLRPR